MTNKIFKMTRLLIATYLVASTTLVFAQLAASGETVLDTVNKVKSTVQAEHGKISSEQLDQKLRDIIYPVFDFKEMSKRCLGANWKKANDQEQEEFTNLFSELLARSYLKQIRDNAKDSDFKVTSAREEKRKAIVQSIVKTPKESIKIDYRLYQKNDSWKVYDVIIENIGLVSNYRSEFGGIVAKEGISGLLKQLKVKVGK